MFKKLLSLAAGAAICFAANAAVVEDYKIDYSTQGWNFWVMNYIPTVQDGVLVASVPYVQYVECKDDNADEYAGCEVIKINNADHYVVPQDEPVDWYQYFVADGIPTIPGTDYIVTVMARASEETSVTLNMGWGWNAGEVLGGTLPLTTEFEEHEVYYEGIGGASCNLVCQTTLNGTIEWKWIKVCHKESASQTQYINLIENGDASQDWPNPTMAADDADRGTVCAWGKEDKGDPHPANIEVVDGDRVFVVHATAMTENPWDNQFWLNAPRAFADGETFKVSFRMKATHAASPGTQAHTFPSNYIHWACIGNPPFDTQWSNYTKDVAVSGAMVGMESIAFNLNDFEGANDYYIDDIVWEVPVIEDGWFIAGDFNDKDWIGAQEMEWDAEEEVYVATVGTKAQPASKIWISNKRGTNPAFLGATLLIAVPDEGIEDDSIYDYTAGVSNNSVDLPTPGIWKITVYPAELPDGSTGYAMVGFNLIEGVDPGYVSDIITDVNAAPEYYNLQGVRVNNPSNGIFIVKRGNNVTKQVIR